MLPTQNPPSPTQLSHLSPELSIKKKLAKDSKISYKKAPNSTNALRFYAKICVNKNLMESLKQKGKITLTEFTSRRPKINKTQSTPITVSTLSHNKGHLWFNKISKIGPRHKRANLIQPSTKIQLPNLQAIGKKAANPLWSEVTFYLC